MPLWAWAGSQQHPEAILAPPQNTVIIRSSLHYDPKVLVGCGQVSPRMNPRSLHPHATAEEDFSLPQAAVPSSSDLLHLYLPSHFSAPCLHTALLPEHLGQFLVWLCHKMWVFPGKRVHEQAARVLPAGSRPRQRRWPWPGTVLGTDTSPTASAVPAPPAPWGPSATPGLCQMQPLHPPCT